MDVVTWLNMVLVLTQLLYPLNSCHRKMNEKVQVDPGSVTVGGLNEPVPVQLWSCQSVPLVLLQHVQFSKYLQVMVFAMGHWWFGAIKSHPTFFKKSNHIVLAITVHFILFSVCMANCVNLHCGLRWCGWCGAAPSVHANVVFVMSCRDVASTTTFLISFNIHLPSALFFNLLWQCTMSLSFAKCHLLGVFYS